MKPYLIICSYSSIQKQFYLVSKCVLLRTYFELVWENLCVATDYRKNSQNVSTYNVSTQFCMSPHSFIYNKQFRSKDIVLLMFSTRMWTLHKYKSDTHFFLFNTFKFMYSFKIMSPYNFSCRDTEKDVM